MIVLLMLGVLVAQRQSGGRLAEAEGDLPSTDGGGNSADRLDDAVCVVEGGLRFELDLTCQLLLFMDIPIITPPRGR